MAGPWLVSGVTYTATVETELKTEHGPADTDACVKLLVVDDGSNILRRIQTMPEAMCLGRDHGDDEDDDENGENGHHHGAPVADELKMFGEVITFPVGLVGIWEIGSYTFTTSADTEFNQKNGSFDVGTVVKVEYLLNPDGTRLATEIKTAFSVDGGDHWKRRHHHHGRGHGDHGEMDDAQAMGVINSLPTTLDLTGIWQIGDISYTVDISTELAATWRTLPSVKKVKVEYMVEEGSRVATEIKIVGAGGGVLAPNEGILFGFVISMPVSTTLGEWNVAGVTLIFSDTSKLYEKHGDVSVGSFVAVKFSFQDDLRTILSIETRVPPGCGEHNFVGKIDSMDDLFAATADAATSTWVIDGQSVTVSEATQLNGELTPSSLVAVNTFTAADGTQEATRISAITLDNQLFLPAVIR